VVVGSSVLSISHEALVLSVWRGPLFFNIPTDLPEEIIETLLDADELRVERIV
jgi:hypothetical protein